MDAQLKAQMNWLRDEVEIEREINKGIKRNRASGEADRETLHLSNHRLVMLEGLQQTVFAATLFSYEPGQPKMAIKKSFKDYIWLIVGGLFIGLFLGCALIEIIGQIKCPCQ